MAVRQWALAVTAVATTAAAAASPSSPSPSPTSLGASSPASSPSAGTNSKPVTAATILALPACTGGCCAELEQLKAEVTKCTSVFDAFFGQANALAADASVACASNGCVDKATGIARTASQRSGEMCAEVSEFETTLASACTTDSNGAFCLTKGATLYAIVSTAAELQATTSTTMPADLTALCGDPCFEALRPGFEWQSYKVDWLMNFMCLELAGDQCWPEIASNAARPLALAEKVNQTGSVGCKQPCVAAACQALSYIDSSNDKTAGLDAYCHYACLKDKQGNRCSAKIDLPTLSRRLSWEWPEEVDGEWPALAQDTKRTQRLRAMEAHFLSKHRLTNRQQVFPSQPTPLAPMWRSALTQHRHSTGELSRLHERAEEMAHFLRSAWMRNQGEFLDELKSMFGRKHSWGAPTRTEGQWDDYMEDMDTDDMGADGAYADGTYADAMEDMEDMEEFPEIDVSPRGLQAPGPAPRPTRVTNVGAPVPLPAGLPTRTAAPAPRAQAKAPAHARGGGKNATRPVALITNVELLAAAKELGASKLACLSWGHDRGFVTPVPFKDATTNCASFHKTFQKCRLDHRVSMMRQGVAAADDPDRRLQRAPAVGGTDAKEALPRDDDTMVTTTGTRGNGPNQRGPFLGGDEGCEDLACYVEQSLGADRDGRLSTFTLRKVALELLVDHEQTLWDNQNGASATWVKTLANAQCSGNRGKLLTSFPLEAAVEQAVTSTVDKAQISMTNSCSALSDDTICLAKEVTNSDSTLRTGVRHAIMGVIVAEVAQQLLIDSIDRKPAAMPRLPMGSDGKLQHRRRSTAMGRWGPKREGDLLEPEGALTFVKEQLAAAEEDILPSCKGVLAAFQDPQCASGGVAFATKHLVKATVASAGRQGLQWAWQRWQPAEVPNGTAAWVDALRYDTTKLRALVRAGKAVVTEVPSAAACAQASANMGVRCSTQLNQVATLAKSLHAVLGSINALWGWSLNGMQRKAAVGRILGTISTATSDISAANVLSLLEATELAAGVAFINGHVMAQVNDLLGGCIADVATSECPATQITAGISQQHQLLTFLSALSGRDGLWTLLTAKKATKSKTWPAACPNTCVGRYHVAGDGMCASECFRAECGWDCANGECDCAAWPTASGSSIGNMLERHNVTSRMWTPPTPTTNNAVVAKAMPLIKKLRVLEADVHSQQMQKGWLSRCLAVMDDQDLPGCVKSEANLASVTETILAQRTESLTTAQVEQWVQALPEQLTSAAGVYATHPLTSVHAAASSARVDFLAALNSTACADEGLPSFCSADEPLLLSFSLRGVAQTIADVMPECAPRCHFSMQGDGVCDAECNVAACNFDTTEGNTLSDCSPWVSAGTGVFMDACSTTCLNSWLGDGVCDAGCESWQCQNDCLVSWDPVTRKQVETCDCGKPSTAGSFSPNSDGPRSIFNSAGKSGSRSDTSEARANMGRAPSSSPPTAPTPRTAPGAVTRPLAPVLTCTRADLGLDTVAVEVLADALDSVAEVLRSEHTVTMSNSRTAGVSPGRVLQAPAPAPATRTGASGRTADGAVQSGRGDDMEAPEWLVSLVSSDCELFLDRRQFAVTWKEACDSTSSTTKLEDFDASVHSKFMSIVRDPALDGMCPAFKDWLAAIDIPALADMDVDETLQHLVDTNSVWQEDKVTIETAANKFLDDSKCDKSKLPNSGAKWGFCVAQIFGSHIPSAFLLAAGRSGLWRPTTALRPESMQNMTTLDQCAPGCVEEIHLGNGWCDSQCANVACGFDANDCGASDVLDFVGFVDQESGMQEVGRKLIVAALQQSLTCVPGAADTCPTQIVGVPFLASLTGTFLGLTAAKEASKLIEPMVADIRACSKSTREARPATKADVGGTMPSVPKSCDPRELMDAVKRECGSVLGNSTRCNETCALAPCLLKAQEAVGCIDLIDPNLVQDAVSLRGEESGCDMICEPLDYDGLNQNGEWFLSALLGRMSVGAPGVAVGEPNKRPAGFAAGEPSLPEGGRIPDGVVPEGGLKQDCDVKQLKESECFPKLSGEPGKICTSMCTIFQCYAEALAASKCDQSKFVAGVAEMRVMLQKGMEIEGTECETEVSCPDVKGWDAEVDESKLRGNAVGQATAGDEGRDQGDRVKALPTRTASRNRGLQSAMDESRPKAHMMEPAAASDARRYALAALKRLGGAGLALAVRFSRMRSVPSTMAEMRQSRSLQRQPAPAPAHTTAREANGGGMVHTMGPACDPPEACESGMSRDIPGTERVSPNMPSCNAAMCRGGESGKWAAAATSLFPPGVEAALSLVQHELTGPAFLLFRVCGRQDGSEEGALGGGFCPAELQPACDDMLQEVRSMGLGKACARLFASPALRLGKGLVDEGREVWTMEDRRAHMPLAMDNREGPKEGKQTAMGGKQTAAGGKKTPKDGGKQTAVGGKQPSKTTGNKPKLSSAERSKDFWSSVAQCTVDCTEVQSVLATLPADCPGAVAASASASVDCKFTLQPNCRAAIAGGSLLTTLAAECAQQHLQSGDAEIKKALVGVGKCASFLTSPEVMCAPSTGDAQPEVAKAQALVTSVVATCDEAKDNATWQQCSYLSGACKDGVDKLFDDRNLVCLSLDKAWLNSNSAERDAMVAMEACRRGIQQAASACYSSERFSANVKRAIADCAHEGECPYTTRCVGAWNRALAPGGDTYSGFNCAALAALSSDVTEEEKAMLTSVKTCMKSRRDSLGSVSCTNVKTTMRANGCCAYGKLLVSNPFLDLEAVTAGCMVTMDRDCDLGQPQDRLLITTALSNMKRSSLTTAEGRKVLKALRKGFCTNTATNCNDVELRVIPAPENRRMLLAASTVEVAWVVGGSAHARNAVAGKVDDKLMSTIRTQVAKEEAVALESVLEDVTIGMTITSPESSTKTEDGIVDTVVTDEGLANEEATGKAVESDDLSGPVANYASDAPSPAPGAGEQDMFSEAQQRVAGSSGAGTGGDGNVYEHLETGSPSPSPQVPLPNLAGAERFCTVALSSATLLIARVWFM